ncbi:glycine-rich protein 1 isoform X2 [Seriola aureovittata]|uniref:glycine-rich protein 1 isoform X2 n=1 Tax=Seriola aureovittata TaxID=2871759 RepID=UPI0024BEE3BA|nr:glycine-rich protein 1 isoform X2 [Seriola aureovittata]
MLPPNLLIVWMVVFLATTVSTAPVEEKEREEVEVEATEEGEGELSEEEEDDDDSKSQDKIEGIPGGQQTTTAAAGGSVSRGQTAGGGRGDGTAGGGRGDGTAGGGRGDGTAGGGRGDGTAESSAGSAGSAAAPELSGVSAGHTEAAGSDGVDSESNGNGQKLLNGGGGGGEDRADSQTGVLGSFGVGVSHLDYTGECPGIIDPSTHDFLLGLMGHMTPPTQLDSTVISSGVTAAPSAEQNSGSSLDSPADRVHQADISIDQSGLDHTAMSSGPDQSLSSSVSGSSHSAVQEAAAASSSSHSEAHRGQTDGGDSPDTNGNGRQTQLTDTNAVTDRPVPFNDLQTDLTGGAQSVTSHIDLTASGLGLGHDVTESSPLVLHTETVNAFTHTLNSVSGVYSHTDLVTMATDSTGTNTVTADPTRSSTDSSRPAVTDHTQAAGSVTEQYNPSGQGPEGAENVELEDTC